MFLLGRTNLHFCWDPLESSLPCNRKVVTRSSPHNTISMDWGRHKMLSSIVHYVGIYIKMTNQMLSWSNLVNLLSRYGIWVEFWWFNLFLLLANAWIQFPNIVCSEWWYLMQQSIYWWIVLLWVDHPQFVSHYQLDQL